MMVVMAGLMITLITGVTSTFYNNFRKRVRFVNDLQLITARCITYKAGTELNQPPTFPPTLNHIVCSQILPLNDNFMKVPFQIVIDRPPCQLHLYTSSIILL